VTTETAPDMRRIPARKALSMLCRRLPFNTSVQIYFATEVSRMFKSQPMSLAIRVASVFIRIARMSTGSSR
jgi:hypothetical protein